MMQSRIKPEPPRKRVLIITEGKKTEMQYFDTLKRRFGLTGVQPYHPNCVDPDSLVDFAIERKRTMQSTGQEPFDEIWIVCDTEGRHSIYRKKLPGAKEKAKRNGIHFAVSCPCFEFWLLLHYVYTTAELPDADAACKALRKHWRNYGKAVPPPSDLMDKVYDAVKRARRIRNDKAVKEPYTDADLPVSSLIPPVFAPG